MSHKITIYTDGAASGNPGPGGYGAVMLSGQHRKELSDGYRKTTNNRMELLAVIIALESLKFTGCNVTIYSDSKYVIDAVEKGWLKNWILKNFKGKKNRDLWERYAQVAKLQNIRFVWVKGHAGNPLNERCDTLAVQASKSTNLKIDNGYESGLYN